MTQQERTCSVKQMVENGQTILGDDESTTWPVPLPWRHWCQLSRIRGWGMVLNSTGGNRFTMAGCLRPDSGWSRTFRIVRMPLHHSNGKVAPLTSQMLRLVHAIFSPSVWPSSRSNVNLRPSPDHRILRNKTYQIRAYDFGVQSRVFFYVVYKNHTHVEASLRLSSTKLSITNISRSLNLTKGGAAGGPNVVVGVVRVKYYPFSHVKCFVDCNIFAFCNNFVIFAIAFLLSCARPFHFGQGKAGLCNLQKLQ